MPTSKTFGSGAPKGTRPGEKHSDSIYVDDHGRVHLKRRRYFKSGDVVFKNMMSSLAVLRHHLAFSVLITSGHRECTLRWSRAIEGGRSLK